MRLGPTARMNVVVKEQKETRLKTFIAAHIEVLRTTGVPLDQITYRLMALSAESPVARVVDELAPDLASAGIRVEAILFQRPAPNAAKTLATVDCRFVTDIRLLDAHEQLVLDPVTAWIGDCMRRDPNKRDTYELYSDRCPITAGNAARSFAQIWRAAGPAGSLTAGRKWAGPRQPNLFDPSLIASADASPEPAILRH